MMKKILILLFLLFPVNSYAVTHIDRTVCPSGCDHTGVASAIAWIASNHPDMVSDDVEIDIVISGYWDSPEDILTAVLIGFITTDSTHGIRIYTTGAARHKGRYDKGNYYIQRTARVGFNEIFDIFTNNVIVDGLIFTGISGILGIRITYTVSSNIVIKNNVFWGTSGGCITSISGASNLYIYNNMGYPRQATGIGIGDGVNYNSSGDSYIYNNTFLSSSTCINIGGSVGSGTLVTNNLCLESSTADFSLGSATGSNNGSSDGTGDVTSLDYTVELYRPTLKEHYRDTHLRSGATSIGAGTDLSGTFTTDIDGETRSSWDLGADEFSAPKFKSNLLF